MTREPSEFPEDVRRLVLHSIHSVEQVTILLLLHSQPDRVWTTAEISHELRSVEFSVESRFADLYGEGILRRLPGDSGRHRFNPGSDELRITIGRLSECYRLRPYRVMELIYSKPNEALRAFSDAFKLRKER